LLLDRKIALALTVLTGFFYYLTFLYPPETMSFPRFLLYSFALFSVLLFLFPGKRRQYEFRELFAREKVITLVTATIYISILQVVGFFAASFLFILLYVWGFERRGFLRPFLVAAASAGGAYIIFQTLLSVSFPRGFLM